MCNAFSCFRNDGTVTSPVLGGGLSPGHVEGIEEYITHWKFILWVLSEVIFTKCIGRTHRLLVVSARPSVQLILLENH